MIKAFFNTIWDDLVTVYTGRGSMNGFLEFTLVIIACFVAMAVCGLLAWVTGIEYGVMALIMIVTVPPILWLIDVARRSRKGGKT